MTNPILIVDDETNVRLNFRIALEMEGYEIFEARSAEQALDMLAERSFALAILDLRLPGMDGLELLAKIRECGNNVPAMFVTACSDVPHAVEAMKLGAIDFLQKPLRPGELRNVVAEILKRCARPDDRPAETFNAHIASAKRCLNLRAFAKARLHLVNALELNPKSVEAFNLAGVLAELLEDYGKAQKCYVRRSSSTKTTNRPNRTCGASLRWTTSAQVKSRLTSETIEICGVFLNCVGRESRGALSGAPAENHCEGLHLTTLTTAEAAYCYADQNSFDSWSGYYTSSDRHSRSAIRRHDQRHLCTIYRSNPDERCRSRWRELPEGSGRRDSCVRWWKIAGIG
jgi:DNA-binding response OmpR family regulator